MRLRLLLTCAALGLGACGGLTSTLPAAAPAASRVGAPAPAVTLAAVDSELARLQRELERRVATREWGVPLQLSRGAEPYLRLRLGADESFDAGTAQLQVAALLLYAEVGAVLRSAPAVTHVLVHGDAPEADAATGLTARRAASVQSYLLAQNIPGTLLRAEGRGAREPATAEAEAPAVNRRVELIVKPIIAGREAEAWMPPPPTGCGACTPDG